MNKRRAFIIVLLVCILSMFCALTACQKKDDDVKDVAVTSVSIDKDVVNLHLGGSNATATLVATVLPNNATNKTVTWSSSKEEIVTVDQQGNLTAVAKGGAVITATAGGKSDTCTVIVYPAAADVGVQSVSLTSAVSLKLGDNESCTLTPHIEPANATNQNVSWSSSDPTVATVNGGKVTALKAGKTTITVTTADGGHTATCEVTVKAATSTDISVKDVSLDVDKLDLKMGGTTTGKLTAIFTPENATDKTVSWKSSDKSVATVDSEGNVTAVGVGHAAITVTTTDGGYTATCQVEVEAATVAVTSVTVKGLTEVTVDKQITLTADVLPENATNKTVTWKVTNGTGEATINANGELTGVKAGDVTVVATAGGVDSAEYKVTVKPAGTTPAKPTITGVTVTSKSGGVTVTVGGQLELTADVEGEGDFSAAVTWKIDSEGFTATGTTLSEGGLLEAGNVPGTVTVVATSVDDTSVSGKLEITVEAAPGPGPDDPAIEYTPDGEYALNLAGPDEGLYTTKIVGSDSGYKKDYFKLSSSSSTGADYLYVNMTLKANKIIKINATGHTSNTTDSSKNVTLGVELKSGSTGTVDGLPATKVIKQADGSQSFEFISTVTAEGTVVLQVYRKSGNTGCELTEFTVTISSPEPVKITGVTMEETTATLKVGETKELTATVSPENADNKIVNWSSSDPTVASVDKDGVVTAKKKGTATITATAAGDTTKSATCKVTVENISVTGITLNKDSNTLAVGKSCEVVATVAPENATIKTVKWTSSDTSIATVENGVITAKGVGTTTIIVATEEEGVDVKATFTITVVANDIPVTGVTLVGAQATETKYVGDALILTATVAPNDALDKSVRWTTSDEAVATVTQSGVVEIVGEGEVTITVTSNNNPNAKATCTITASYQTFKVTFMDGTTNKGDVHVRKGEKITQDQKPTLTQEGFALVGWGVGSATGASFDFNTAITEDITLYAKWQKSEIKITYKQGNWESAAIEWADKNATSSQVFYKLENEPDSAYVEVDNELIRQIDSSTGRVDVLGLKGNQSYAFKVKSSTLGESVEVLPIKAYDRSGYAHFGYTKGIGAYKDDGTLKDNTIVIYVTDENKDTVMKDVVAKYAGVPGYESLKMFNIPYCADSEVKTNWNKTADGIGWWMNNAQYTMNNLNSSKNKSPSNTYDATNGSKLGFRGVTNPIVIRFIGEVGLPEGCTAYNSVGEGGSVGDNGTMARMKNCANITLEGVGEDAMIHGWGIHFMGGTDATGDQGKSFEVRNLTFYEYAEDAVGMEGVQGGDVITGPVERCWIHHNTFLPGHCANPAESDKAEGDGSCDFKRGQYLTCAYNWFEYCHKTNLVGSSDDSLQFNLTYHHNTWWQCGSRIPLARQANIHFYNNYVYGNQSEKTTPYSWISKPALSYVHSLRANCYIFTEGNYYDGCKNVTDGKNGGKAKGWNNIYFACEGTNTVVDATDREQTISGTCSYSTYDYSHFDTDSTLFYYDSANKVSNCNLTDAATARAECLKYSGVLKHDYDIDTSMVKDRPSKALTVPTAGLTVNVSQAAAGKEVDGVLFLTQAKGKDALAVFTLAENTEVHISGTGIEIANVNGEFIAHESFDGNLEAGTYFIHSYMKNKEGTISAMSFKTGVTNEERVAKVVDLIDAIGTVANTPECKAKIEAAQTAYSALTSELQKQVTNAATLTAKVNEYNGLVVAPVIQAINEIGTVDATSGGKITAARTAYSKLTAEQAKLVTNYDVLVAAEAAYVNFKVEGINNEIAALKDPSTATTEEAIRSLLEEYNNVKHMYDVLADNQKDGVTNYSKVTNGITALNAALAPYEVKEDIAALPAAADVTLANSSAIVSARKAYDALTADQKTIVGDISKLTAAEAALGELASQTVIWNHTAGLENCDNKFFTVNGNSKDVNVTEGGVTYTKAIKMESSTSITFTTATEMQFTLYADGTGTEIKIDDTSYTISGGKVTVALSAGSHTVKKGSTNVFVYLMELGPVA